MEENKAKDLRGLRICCSFKIEDEHGASITISETLDRKHLAISTRRAPARKGGNGDPRVFLTQKQIDQLFVAGYSLNMVKDAPWPGSAETNTAVVVSQGTAADEEQAADEEHF